MSLAKSTFVAIISSLVLASAAYAETGRNFDGWRIAQRCILQGDEQVVLCNHGVKIHNPKNDLTILFVAPFKEVIYFDKHTGLTCKVPAEKNTNPYNRTIGMFSGLSLADVPLKRIAPSKLLGLPTSNYATDETYSKEQVNQVKLDKHNNNRFKFVNLAVFTSLGISSIEQEFLARHYGLSSKVVDGAPANLLYHSMSDRSTVYLSTQRCEKSKISESEFAVPPNLKTVNSAQAVITGDNPGILLF